MVQHIVNVRFQVRSTVNKINTVCNFHKQNIWLY